MNKTLLTFSLLLVSTSTFAQTDLERQDALPEISFTSEQVINFLEKNQKARGACVYSTIGTFVCKDDVTKEWCDMRPNSEFGEDDTCE